MTAPGRSRQVRWLIAGFATSMLGMGIFIPISLLFFTEVSGISLQATGLALGFAGLLTLPLPLVLGGLIDRLGPRDVVVVALVLQSVGSFGSLLIWNVWTLGLTALVGAVGNRMFWSSVFGLVADIVPASDRDRWYGAMSAAQAAGFGLGAFAAASLIAVGGPGAYPTMVVLNAVAFLLAAGLIFGRVTGGRARVAAVQTTTRLMPDSRYLSYIGVNSLFAVCTGAIGICLPVYVSTALDAPDWVVGVLLGTNTAAIALFQSLVVRWVRPFRRTRTLGASGLTWAVWGVMSALALVVPAAYLVPFLFLAVLVYTAAELLHASTSMSLAASAAPEGARARYLSAFQLSFAVANTVSPILFTQLFAVGPAAPWVMIAVIGVSASVGMIRLERRLPSGADRVEAMASAG